MDADNIQDTGLRCSVCGRNPWWSLPRPGDSCPENDGGLLVVATVKADALDAPLTGIDQARSPAELLRQIREKDAIIAQMSRAEGPKALRKAEAEVARLRRLEEAMTRYFADETDWDGEMQALEDARVALYRPPHENGGSL